MRDDPKTTETLQALYRSGDWILRVNFWGFFRFSGLDRLPRDIPFLDCGCAMGHFLRMARERGFSNLAGLDAAPEMAEAARGLAGARIVCADALQLATAFEPASFGVLTALNLQHHLGREPEWDRFVAGCATLLRPGGLLFVREPYPTLAFRLLNWMSRRPFFFRFGFLRRRLDSLVGERELLDYFMARWPGAFRGLLERNGFQPRKDFNWMGHKVIVAEKCGPPRG